MVQGRIFLEDTSPITPQGNSRASFLEVLKSFMAMTWSFINHSQDNISTPPLSDTATFGTLAAGEYFAIVDEGSARELDEASRTHCDQITVSSSETCWTIEVHRSDNAGSLWLLAKQRVLNTIFIREAVS